MKSVAAALFALVWTGSFALALAPKSNPYGDQLARLDEWQRFAALRSAVNNGGQYCKRVTAAVRQGPYKNLEMWSIRCTPGGDYGAFIGPDSSVQVSKCAEHAQLKMPPCRLPKAK